MKLLIILFGIIIFIIGLLGLFADNWLNTGGIVIGLILVIFGVSSKKLSNS